MIALKARGACALALATLLFAPAAHAQKQGGILKSYVWDTPPSASIHEEATISTVFPFMPVFNNLVLFDQTKLEANLDTIVPDLGNPTFQAILRGLSRAAAADDYHVLVADSAESVEEERVLAGATRRRTDGIILCSPRLPQDELDRLVGGLRPVVLINRASGDVPSVRADYRSALATELAHLQELGHRRIVFLAGAPGSVANAARLDAIASFVADPSLRDLDESGIVRGPASGFRGLTNLPIIPNA